VSEERSPFRRAAGNPYLLAGVWTVAALVLRLYRLEDQSLWNDEMFTLDVVRHSLGEIQQTLIAGYHHPPLYFYVARVSVLMFGLTAFAIRIPSAIFGAITVGCVVLVGEKTLGRRAAIAAATLLLVAPLHLAYSQEGRPYALAALLCLLSTYAFFRLLEAPSVTRQVFYGLALCALLYTHHWGLFVALAQGLYWLMVARRQPFAPLLLWAMVGLAYLPELFVLRHQSLAGPPAQWFWAESPSWAELFHLGTAFSGSAFTMASSVFALPIAFQIIGAVSIAALLAGCLRQVRGSMTGAFVAIFLCILAIPFFLSFFKPEIFLWYRYTVIPFPLLALGAGGMVERRSWATVLVVVLIAVGVVGAIGYGSWQKSSGRDVAAYVEEETSGDVRLIIRPASYAPILNAYYRGDALQLDEAYLDTPLGEVVDTARGFVYVSLDVPNRIREYLDAHFAKRAERRFPGEAHLGIVVGMYRQRPEEE
jgi:uncharacterized membrane protein